MILAALGLPAIAPCPPPPCDLATYRSARALAADVADAANLSADAVFEALTCVPENMLSLLASPEGWSALAQYVAADLGVQALNYAPRVH
jgi:hypothetical protein